MNLKKMSKKRQVEKVAQCQSMDGFQRPLRSLTKLLGIYVDQDIKPLHDSEVFRNTSEVFRNTPNIEIELESVIPSLQLPRPGYYLKEALQTNENVYILSSAKIPPPESHKKEVTKEIPPKQEEKPLADTCRTDATGREKRKKKVDLKKQLEALQKLQQQRTVKILKEIEKDIKYIRKVKPMVLKKDPKKGAVPPQTGKNRIQTKDPISLRNKTKLCPIKLRRQILSDLKAISVPLSL